LVSFWSAVASETNYRIVKLVSGAHSVHSLAYDETFHPVIGPVAEAEALYVRQLKLRERVEKHSGEFVIWDVGLGAAANPITVLKGVRDLPVKIGILSFDETVEPLQFALTHAESLGYVRGYEEHLQTLIGNGGAEFRDHCAKIEWTLHISDFPTLIQSQEAQSWLKPHAILFDAYSPARNPAMWTQPLFARIYELLDPARPCAMPTYSRSTMLRVSLLLAGLFVGAGQATGEKEETTIAANSLGLIDEPLDHTWLKRARNSTSAEPLWEPVYRQARLSPTTLARLEAHPQFATR
jgi:tRNA U34 5-methylaminomethyl-2-thiouridine-forming methyltransferase MnmC